MIRNEAHRNSNQFLKYVCRCGGELRPVLGGYHPGIMVLRCLLCGRKEERPCTCSGQSGYCSFCGVKLNRYSNI